MKKKLITVLAALPALLLALRVAAHEGHGDPRLGETVLHYLLEPEHALFGVLVTIGFGLMLARASRAWSSRHRPGQDASKIDLG